MVEKEEIVVLEIRGTLFEIKNDGYRFYYRLMGKERDWSSCMEYKHDLCDYDIDVPHQLARLFFDLLKEKYHTIESVKTMNEQQEQPEPLTVDKIRLGYKTMPKADMVAVHYVAKALEGLKWDFQSELENHLHPAQYVEVELRVADFAKSIEKWFPFLKEERWKG